MEEISVCVKLYIRYTGICRPSFALNVCISCPGSLALKCSIGGAQPGARCYICKINFSFVIKMFLNLRIVLNCFIIFVYLSVGAIELLQHK